MASSESPDRLEALVAVRRGADAIEAAVFQRDESIRAAHEAGAAILHIAEAARMTRQTVYRIIGGQAGLPPKAQWAQHLDDTLQLIIDVSCGDPVQMKDALAGLGSKDLTVKARRVQWCAKRLTEPLREGQRHVYATGSEIAAEVLKGSS